MKRLVAAFEPFAGRRRNRAWQAARRLAADEDVEVARLPVSFARLPAAIDALLARAPDVLLLVGEAHDLDGLEVERLAINLADARVPDNDGAQPRDQALMRSGPVARKVAIDVSQVVDAIRKVGVSAVASAHAGTFCCNAALYLALEKASPGTKVAFIHVPDRRRRMRAKTAAAGLRAALSSLVAHSD